MPGIELKIVMLFYWDRDKNVMQTYGVGLESYQKAKKYLEGLATKALDHPGTDIRIPISTKEELDIFFENVEKLKRLFLVKSLFEKF